MAASNTAIDDVTNYITNRIFNTDIQYSYTHFVIEADENLASLTVLIRFNHGCSMLLTFLALLYDYIMFLKCNE